MKMDQSNRPTTADEKPIESKENIKELLKDVAIYEAKSAIAKVKLAKIVVLKSADALGKGTKKFGAFIDKQVSMRKKNK